MNNNSRYNNSHSTFYQPMDDGGKVYEYILFIDLDFYFKNIESL